MCRAHPPALEQDEGLIEEDGQVERLAISAGEHQIDQLLHHLHTASLANNQLSNVQICSERVWIVHNDLLSSLQLLLACSFHHDCTTFTLFSALVSLVCMAGWGIMFPHITR